VRRPATPSHEVSEQLFDSIVNLNFKAGANPARVREALMGGFAALRVLEVHGERMIDRSFDPGFRIRLHQKDLCIALDGARVLGLSLPVRPMRNNCPAPAWRMGMPIAITPR